HRSFPPSRRSGDANPRSREQEPYRARVNGNARAALAAMPGVAPRPRCLHGDRPWSRDLGTATLVGRSDLRRRRSARGMACRAGLCYVAQMAARSPEECDALFERHLNAGDLDALVSLYEPGATLVPSPDERVVGQAAIREALGAFIAAKAKLSMKVGHILW